MPTLLLTTGVIFANRVEDRSNRQRTLFRTTSEVTKRPIYAGDDWQIKIGYRVDNDLHWRGGDWFEELVKVRAFVAGKLVATRQLPMRELQCF